MPLSLTLTIRGFSTPSPIFKATPYWQTNHTVANITWKSTTCIIRFRCHVSAAGFNSVCRNRKKRTFNCWRKTKKLHHLVKEIVYLHRHNVLTKQSSVGTQLRVEFSSTYVWKGSRSLEGLIFQSYSPVYQSNWCNVLLLYLFCYTLTPR